MFAAAIPSTSVPRLSVALLCVEAPVDGRLVESKGRPQAERPQ